MSSFIAIVCNQPMSSSGCSFANVANSVRFSASLCKASFSQRVRASASVGMLSSFSLFVPGTSGDVAVPGRRNRDSRRNMRYSSRLK